MIRVVAGADRAALAAQLSEVRDRGAVTGVVSLLALATEPLREHPVVAAGLAGTLVLVQALGDAGWRAAVGADPGRGGGRAGGSGVQRGAGAGVGPGPGGGAGAPDRWGGLVDLPPVLDERGAALLRAVLAGCGEDQVAIRAAGVAARRLARAAGPGAGQAWAPRGTVLVTGGTGALGGHVARWAASRGAPRLVLASRSGPAAAGAAALAAGLAQGGPRSR